MKHLRILVFPVLFFLAALNISVPLVSASGPAPVNGKFEGSTGWLFFGGTWYDPTTSYDAYGGSGHGDNRNNNIMSMRFLVGSGAVLTYYTKSEGRVNVGATVFDWTTYTTTFLGSINNPGAWTLQTFNLGGFAGDEVSIDFTGDYDPYWIDNVDVSNSTALGAANESSLNGTFMGSMWGWAGDGVWSSGVGHNAPGSARADHGYRNNVSRPFHVNSAAWSLWTGCNSYPCDGSGPELHVYVGEYGGSNPGWHSLLDYYPSTDVWTEVTFDMTDYVGKDVTLFVSQYADYVDDICSATNCTEGTPTPTVAPTQTAAPTATAGATSTPGATSTRSGFPTQIPYPTFPAWPTVPPYPTQLSYPTSIYGPGTAQPVIIVPGSPIPVYLVTPLPTPVPQFTQIPFPTRLPTWTPIPTKTPEPTLWNFGQPTTISMGSSSASNLNLGGSLASKGIPDFSGSSDVTPPVLFETTRIVMGPIAFNLEVVKMPTLSITLNYTYISTFSFLGIPMLSAISGIGACWLAVFIFKRLRQQR